VIAPDIEWEPDPRHPQAGIHRGRDSFRRFVEDLDDPFEGAAYVPQKFFSNRDHVVVFVTIRRRPPGSSAELAIQIGTLWRLRSGTIVRGQGFAEREKALEALGLSE
jgi:ketosteroid isomerase-like protein